MNSEPVDKELDEILEKLHEKCLMFGLYNDHKVHAITSHTDHDGCTDEAKQTIKTLIADSNRLAIEEYIKPYLDYCQELNGLPFCKNCGLEAQDKSRKKK